MLAFFDPSKSFSYYQKNEFCKAIEYPELPKRVNREKHNCSECMAYKFHDYLDTNKYHLIKNVDTNNGNRKNQFA